MAQGFTIATFPQRQEAEAAIRKLVSNGIVMRQLSIVSEGLFMDEQALNYINRGDKVRLWGMWGAFWGWLFGLVFGPMFRPAAALAFPVTPLAWLTTAIIDAIMFGAIAALTALAFNWRMPNNTNIQFLQQQRAQNYKLVIRGSMQDAERARGILSGLPSPESQTVSSAADTETME